MSTTTDNRRSTASIWKRFHTWGKALDEALHHDPIEQLETRLHELNKRVAKIEGDSPHPHRSVPNAETINCRD